MSINKDSQKAPNLRFKGFTDDWEPRKLGDVSENFEYGLNASATAYDGVNKYIRITDIDEASHLFLQDNLTSPDVDFNSADDYLLEENDILFARTGASVGKTYQYRSTDGKVYYAGFLIRAKVKSEFDSSFIFQSTLTNQYNNFIKVTSQRSGQPGVNAKEYASYTLHVPKKGEQEKIGTLFKQMDITVTLHQRKLDQLRQLKEAFLQQMFPGKGETVPTLRFAGFEGDWEERKLGELGETKSGIGFPDDEQGGKKGIPFFKVSDMNNIGNEHELKNSNNYVDTEQLKRRNWKPIMNVPAVIFAKVGAAIMLNRKRIVRMPFLLDNNTMAYIFDDSWNSDFGKILFETIYLPRYAQVGALPSYNGSDISSIKVFIPNKKEQEKIGVFFKQLDNTITLQQRKLDQLQNMKQVLLQNMFI